MQVEQIDIDAVNAFHAKSFEALFRSTGPAKRPINEAHRLVAEAFARHRHPARAEVVGEIVAMLDERISVYQQKRDKADPLADETFNKHEALTYVIEALEIVEESLGEKKWNTSSALSSAESGPSSVTSLDLTKE